MSAQLEEGVARMRFRVLLHSRLAAAVQRTIEDSERGSGALRAQDVVEVVEAHARQVREAVRR